MSFLRIIRTLFRRHNTSGSSRMLSSGDASSTWKKTLTSVRFFLSKRVIIMRFISRPRIFGTLTGLRSVLALEPRTVMKKSAYQYYCHCSEAVDLSFQSHDSLSPETPDHVPIFIMHGLLGSKSNWNSLAKAIHLRTKRKVINVDARNHGDSPHADKMDYDSMAKDLLKLITELKYKKATLVGHSMGGKTMMTVALNNPELVSSLVVVDIAPGTRPRAASDIPRIVDALLRVRVTPGRSQWALRKDADRQLQSDIPDKYLRQFLLTNLVEEGGVSRWRVNLPVIQRSLPALSDFPVPPSAAFDGPTLFVGGQNSDYIEPSARDEIRARFPAARLVWIPDAGHWVHSERPAEFLDVVCPVLAS